MKSRLNSLITATTMALLLTGSAHAAEEPGVIRFSDPSKPGTVKISLGKGELQVQGADTNEVTVRTDAKAVTSKPRKDGLRVISAASGYNLREKDNVITLDAVSDLGRSGGDFKIIVPRTTTVVVQNAWGGDITCSGLAGDIEINAMHGEIRLDDVKAGVVVSTMNGGIRANIREFREGKPLSFTSMNGEVTLRVPNDAKANVRLRTQNGSVLTDFEEGALVTKTESSPGMPRFARISTSRNGKVITAEVQEAIREAAQIGASAVKEALEAVKEGIEAARVDGDEARRELDRARRELERAHLEAARERVRVRKQVEVEAAPVPPEAPAAPAAAAAPKPAAAPAAPKIAIPTMSGGKLVTGTLNGGGPEISVSTMNGDVVLRKL